jgi:ABC-2 type transport system permease protein
VSDAALVLKQTRYGLVESARNPRVLVFSIAFPIVLLVMFNGIFASGDNATTEFAGGTISTDAYFTAGILAYAILMSSFSTLAIGLTTRRESGQLKRMRGTPMPPWTFITAEMMRCVVQIAAMTVVMMVIAHVVFDVDLHGDSFVGFVVYVALGTAALAAVGVALTAFLSSADAASTVAPFSAVILSFVSGVFIPVETLPNWLEEVGRVFPLYHLAEGLQTTLVSGTDGTGLDGGNVAVLAVWGLAGLAIAARRFRWEPRARG